MKLPLVVTVEDSENERRGIVVHAVDLETFITICPGYRPVVDVLEDVVENKAWDWAYDPWENAGGEHKDLTWIPALGKFNGDTFLAVVVLAPDNCPHGTSLTSSCPLCQKMGEQAWWYSEPEGRVVRKLL